MRKKIFLFLFITISVIAPWQTIRAEYNTYTWGTDTILFFPGVAATAGGTSGISINVLETSYLNYYALDNTKLVVEMYPGSKISLKSNDRKMFRTNIATADTVCADSYSTFSYSTPGTYGYFIITFTDGDNCPAVQKAEPVDTVIPANKEQIDVTNLDRIAEAGITKILGQNSKTHFVLGNVVETVEVLSVGATEAKMKLSVPDKEINLSLNKEKTIDTDANGWNDLSLVLKSTDGGQAELALKILPEADIVGVGPGDLIKIAKSKAVYYIGADSRRYVFPNDKVYFTWYESFSGVKTISDADMAKLSIAGLVTYRPGVKMVKFMTSPDVYAVSQGGALRKLKDEQMAKDLYGIDWNKQIDDINDAFFGSYTFGEPVGVNSDFVPVEKEALTPTIAVDKGL
jgi:hypothetical protein